MVEEDAHTHNARHTHSNKQTNMKKEGLALDIGMTWSRVWTQPKRKRKTRNKVRHLGKHDGGLYQTEVGIPAGRTGD